MIKIEASDFPCINCILYAMCRNKITYEENYRMKASFIHVDLQCNKIMQVIKEKVLNTNSMYVYKRQFEIFYYVLLKDVFKLYNNDIIYNSHMILS